MVVVLRGAYLQCVLAFRYADVCRVAESDVFEEGVSCRLYGDVDVGRVGRGVYGTDARLTLVRRTVVVFEHLDCERSLGVFSQFTDSECRVVTLTHLYLFVEDGGVSVARRRNLYLVSVGREFEVLAYRTELHVFEDRVTVYVDINVRCVGRGVYDAQFPRL